MEHCGMGMGAVFDGEWESLCKLLTFDDPNFETDQFLSHSASSLTTPSIDDGLTCNLPDNQNSFSQCTINSYEYDRFPLQLPNYENYHVNECSNLEVPDDAFLPTNFLSGNGAYDTLFASLYAHEDGSSSSQTSGAESQSTINVQSAPKRVLSAFDMETGTEKNDGSSAIPPKKKARGKNKGKKGAITSGNDEDDMTTNAGSISQSASAEASDEGSVLSQENSEGENSACKDIEGVASKGKKRASRGAATDPQSLYARKRRERINERLRILQTLVPNGTKVDISTMLDEALHYVKFLQLQIRLLSSDDMWMYAPLAYNGVDISVYKRISPFLLP